MADGGSDAVYVFMCLIVLKNQDGIIEFDGRRLAKYIDLSQERFDAAIGVLMAPDPVSNLPAMEGRRIVAARDIDWHDGNRGYYVVNHEHYREKGGAVDQRAKGAERQQRWRDRNAQSHVTPRNDAVTPRNASSVHTDTDTDTDTEEECASGRRTATLFEDFWKAYPVKKEKKKAREVWLSKGLDDKAGDILTAVALFSADDPQWQKGFIPHPTTFLRGERWKDEIKLSDNGERNYV